MTRDPRRPHYAVPLVVALLVLLAALIIGVATGATDLAGDQVVRALLAALGLDVAVDPITERIVRALRLPRVIRAGLAGAALALAGGLLAGSLRCRYAEPATTGTAGGALLGSSIALFLVPADPGSLVGAYWPRALLSAAFALAATLAVVHAARRQGGDVLVGPLLVGGLAVNAVVGALAALLLFIGPVGTQMGATLIVSWTFGGLLAATGAASSYALVLVLLVAAGVLVAHARPLDIMLLGTEAAAAGGVAVGRLRLVALVTAALLTGFAVAAAGVIAFVGLVALTLVRRWTGPQHLRALPVAALVGAAILILADAAGRHLGAPAEVPAGVLTAALGAPFLLAFMSRNPGGHA